jgi:hypothetical protein
MPAHRRRIRSLAWLPLLAVLALNLLGFASQAMVFSQLGQGPALPCPMHVGMMISGGNAEGDEAQAVGAGCPLIALAAVQAVPLPAAVAAAPAPGLRHAQAALFLHAPHTLFAWASPRSRGPPALG